MKGIRPLKREEFIVNTSGGYKSVSAYAMLYAQLREAPLTLYL